MKNKLNVLISCEMSKIFSQRKYRIYPIIVSLLVLGGAGLSLIPGNSLTFTLGNYTYTVLSLLCYVFAPIGIFMLAGDLIGGELADGNMDLLFTRASRGSVLLGKAIAIGGYTALLMLGQLALSGIISWIAGGAVYPLTALLAYALGLLPMLALTALASFIAASTRSGTSTFAICLLAYLGCGVLGVVLSGVAPALFTSYLGLGGLVIGSTLPLLSLLMGVTVCSMTALVFLSVAGLRFSSVEL